MPPPEESTGEVARRHTAAFHHRVRGEIEIPADYFPDDLVAWNYSRHSGREFAFDYVQVGPANATSPHTQQEMTGPALWGWHVYNREGAGVNSLGMMQDGGFHQLPSCIRPALDKFATIGQHWPNLSLRVAAKLAATTAD